MQTNANNFNNNNDEEWKLPNNQATTEFRRKVIGFLQSNAPSLSQQQYVEIESRCFQETQTKVDYFNKVKSTISSFTQQQQQQQQQQPQIQQQIQQPQHMNVSNPINQQQQPQQQQMLLQNQYKQTVQIVSKNPIVQPMMQQQQPPQQNPTIIKQIGQPISTTSVLINNPNQNTMQNLGAKSIINLSNQPNPQQINQQPIQQQQQLQTQQQMNNKFMNPNQQHSQINHQLIQQQQIRPTNQQQFQQNNPQQLGSVSAVNQHPNGNPAQTYIIQQQQQINPNQPSNNIQTGQLNQHPNMMAKIRPANMINAGISQPQQQMPQQQSLNIINNNNNIAPTNQIANNNQPNIPTQFNNIGQQQQQQQQPMAQVNASNTADDELYNKKIEELRLHLPRLERMHSSALGRANQTETQKIKAFIDVINGTKRVSMAILLKCEDSLNQQSQMNRNVAAHQNNNNNMQQQQQLQQQVQFQQQQQQIPINPPIQPIINQTQNPVLARPQQPITSLNQPPNQQNLNLQSQPQPIQQQQQLPQPHQMISINQPQVKIQKPSNYVAPQDSQSSNQITIQSQHQLQLQQQQQQQHQQQMQIQQQLQQQQQQQKQNQLQNILQIPPSNQPNIQSINQVQIQNQPAMKPVVPPQQQQQQQQPQPIPVPTQNSKFQILSQNIESCNNSNQFHKNNVRSLIDNVQTTLHGPPIKLIKIENDNFKVTSENTNDSFKRKRLVNLRNHLTPANNISNEKIPKKLLNELAALPNSQFRIEIKSKYQSLVLPKLKLESESENESDIDNTNFSNSSPLENDYVNLNCKIINRKLYLVPPIRIFVPYNYPDSNPIVDNIQLDEFNDDMLPKYNELSIHRRINKIFQINYLKLPERFSVTQILDAWYTSVENI